MPIWPASCCMIRVCLSLCTARWVTRNSGTSGTLTVNLISSDVNEATVPDSVDILVGDSLADFVITLIDDDTVGSNPDVTITASASGHTSGNKTFNRIVSAFF